MSIKSVRYPMAALALLALVVLATFRVGLAAQDAPAPKPDEPVTEQAPPPPHGYAQQMSMLSVMPPVPAPPHPILVADPSWTFEQVLVMVQQCDGTFGKPIVVTGAGAHPSVMIWYPVRVWDVDRWRIGWVVLR